MDNAGRTRQMRRLAAPALAAMALAITLTVVASADSHSAVWSGAGEVLYSGLSPDATLPTVTDSEFRLKRDGAVRSVEIRTANEFFVGILGGGPGGPAITACRDRRGSNACEEFSTLLTGAEVVSIHNSTAVLDRVTEHEVELPVLTPAGPVSLNIPVLSGSLRGHLRGQFAMSKGSGAASGTVELRIGRGSTASYACFGGAPLTPVPLESLQPCIEQSGGQLLPILLDVHDSGSFELGPGSGELADILMLQGRVSVNVNADMLQQRFAGSIMIPKASASFVDTGPPVLNGSPRMDKGNTGDN